MSRYAALRNRVWDTKHKDAIMSQSKINDVFGKPLTVVNVGLASMAESVEAQGIPTVDVDWQPPADGIARLALTPTPGVDIEAANTEVTQRITVWPPGPDRHGNRRRTSSQVCMTG